MESKELLINNVEKYIVLNDEEKEMFISSFKYRKLKKHELLLYENEISVFTAFVTKGCLRSYSIDSNGFEHIIQFAPVDWWIGDIQSLVFQREGLLNVDAIEDSEVLLLFREDQLKLFDLCPKFERFFRILIEKALASSRQRLLDNLSLNAQHRYLSFCRQYPSLINSLPQKYIAAYIGVTPEFLSKIRKDIVKSKRE